MAVNITFRHNLPPVIRNSHPAARIQHFRSPVKAMPKREKPVHNENQQNGINDILKELEDMIGLQNVKKFINELQAFVAIQKKRQKENLLAEPLVLHMIFSGNPGSGKTTVARIVGRLLKELGVLQKGHILECERADLVGEYIGHTANKTREMVRKALGGVLFIDEAYSLARGGDKDFGKEAIDALVKAMEDHKDNLVLILAGYRAEMERFIQTNPGLRSRFPIHINFPDYTIEELVSIGELMLNKREYLLMPGAKLTFKRMLQDMCSVHPYAGNARMVRNIVEKAIRKQAVRLYNRTDLSRKDLMSIIEADLCNDDV